MCIRDSLPDAGLGIAGIRGNHGLDADWVFTAHADCPDHYFPRHPPLVAEEVGTVVEWRRIAHLGIYSANWECWPARARVDFTSFVKALHKFRFLPRWACDHIPFAMKLIRPFLSLVLPFVWILCPVAAEEDQASKKDQPGEAPVTEAKDATDFIRIEEDEKVARLQTSVTRYEKDGVTVAKEIELEGKFENMGAQMVKEVASKTNDTAGDGTTTATLLAQAIVREGLKSVAAGMNPMDLKRGIEMALDSGVATIK